MKNIIDEIKKVIETGILPDGDHVNIPTQMWLQCLLDSDNFETNFIPFSVVETLIKKLQLGRNWCGICDSPDHECGCSINVHERYRLELIEEFDSLRGINYFEGKNEPDSIHS